MRAVIAQSTGGPEVLAVTDRPVPSPGPGEVAIDVAYAGLNFVEVMHRRGDGGIEAPFIPGYEVAGTVRSVGDGVDAVPLGSPVAAITGTGGYAEVALAPVHQVTLLNGHSETLGLDVAAAFPTIVPTAWTLLQHVARLRAGETVLVHAAAGAVGTIAVQVARHLGASRIVGTVGDDTRIAYAREAGYTDVLVRSPGWKKEVLELTDGRGVDVVLDSVGGRVRPESLAALAPLGRLVLFGNASAAPDVEQSTHELWFSNKAVLGFAIGPLFDTAPALAARYSAEALALLADGTIKIDITDVLPLEAAADGHRRLEQRQTTGKLLLRVGADAGDR